jgi:hypothetical protein
MVFFFRSALEERRVVAKNQTHNGRTSFQKLLFAYSIGKRSSSNIDRADAQGNIAQSSVTCTQELKLVYPPANSVQLQFISQALGMFILWLNNRSMEFKNGPVGKAGCMERTLESLPPVRPLITNKNIFIKLYLFYVILGSLHMVA